MAAETETETDTKLPISPPPPPSDSGDADAPPPPSAPDELTATPTDDPPVAGDEDPKIPADVEAEAPVSAPKSVSLGDESSDAAAPEVVVDPQRRALDELKLLIASAIANNEFSPPSKASEEPPSKGEEPSETTVESIAETPATISASEETIKAPPLQLPSPEDATKESPLQSPAPEDTIKEPPFLSPEPEDTIKELPFQSSEKEEEKKEAPLESVPPPPEEVRIWGVPLVGDERSDTILFKFLQARDFKVKEAFDMIKDCVIWRKQFDIEGLLNEDLGFPEMNKVVFMHGFDREGHPVCYNIYGDFQNEEFYEKAFGDAEKRHRFIKWRIQYLEKGIRELLDFRPGGVSSMVQVTDFKNAPQFGKHRTVARQIVTLLQDNYPEFIAKKIFINVPWWNLAAFWMMNVLTQRTKSKFVFAGPSKSAETLFKYIAPEQVPVAYGGLSKEQNPEFTTSDAAMVVTIKPSSKQSIEIPAAEGSLVVWELRVIDWDVTYGAEFVPSVENGYTLIVQKPRKFVETDEPVIENSFKFSQPGKLFLSIDNQTSKKKLLLYRFKVKISIE